MIELKKECSIFKDSSFKTFLFENFSSRQNFEAAILPNKTLYLTYDLSAYSHESFYFLENINEIKENENLDNVIINLKDILWIDSTSITTLIRLRKLFEGAFCLYNLNNDLEEMFEMLNLDKVMNIYSDKYDAFEYISKNLN